MVVVKDFMKLLVMEQNDLVTKIYKKLLDKMQYEADFAKDDSELFDRFQDSYDYVVIEKPVPGLEQKIRKIKPLQKILSLSEHTDFASLSEINDSQSIIDKPFAILTMFGKIKIESVNHRY